MSMEASLSMTAGQHSQIYQHLFPGDGLEAVAILLCGRRAGDRRHRLLVREIHPVPHDECNRATDRVTWPTDEIDEILNRAQEAGLSVLKIHSHPSGYAQFSNADDESDAALLPAIRQWIELDVPHGSAVMLPTGETFGRVLDGEGLRPISCVNVVGDDLRFWYQGLGSAKTPSFAASVAQIFDQGTIERLQRLSVAVIGASGTGSPVIEQLVRLGVGEIVIVDDDVMEERNVNRILNSTLRDAHLRRSKSDVLGDAIERIGLNTKVIRITRNLWEPETVRAVGQCDVVFGCMDTIDGRFLLNMLASFYTQAYFDIGVRLDAVAQGVEKGRIREVCGSIHYIQPAKSSLLTRELFSIEGVAAAGLRRTDPEAHLQQLADGYIKGVAGHRPAVISVNMLAASLAVSELLARLHPYREKSNSEYAQVTFSLASVELILEPETAFDICAIMSPVVGRGDTTPLLRLPELSERKER